MQYHVTANQINFGNRIIPTKRVELFSFDEWEEFIEEWLDLKRDEYFFIERFGGAGDKGRDVVAQIDLKTKNYAWDCYQCKHYDQPLMPTQVYVEFGKILYYTYINDYTIPRNYYFVSPKSCGTSLSSLLSSPSNLKDEVIKNWDKYCKDKITKTEEVKLSGSFLEYCQNFDFGIFKKILPKIVIEEHSKHPNHLIRFGGGLPEREKLNKESIPQTPLGNENRYVKQLLLAYGSDSNTEYNSLIDISKDIYKNHFKRSRLNFHYAEQLRNFSRDNLPVGTFEDFQGEIYEGVIGTAEEEDLNGFKKIKEIEKIANNLSITSNPLKDVSVINDRSGVCHQLINDEKLTIVNDK